MKDYKFDAAEVQEHRDALMGIEILLNQLYSRRLYEMEAAETEIVVQALATDSKARLDKALEWLERMQEQAEEMKLKAA